MVGLCGHRPAIVAWGSRAFTQPHSACHVLEPDPTQVPAGSRRLISSYKGHRSEKTAMDTSALRMRLDQVALVYPFEPASTHPMCQSAMKNLFFKKNFTIIALI